MVKSVEEIVKEIDSFFSSDDRGIIDWTREKQEIVNQNLTVLADKMGVFDYTIGRERKNIREDLTIIGPEGENIELVDSEKMEERVKGLLNNNTMFSLLRAAALTNKCAHGYDARISSLTETITELDDSFAENINALPRTTTSNTYTLKKLSEREMKIFFSSFVNPSVTKASKIQALKTVGIDPRQFRGDDVKINKAFDDLKGYSSVLFEEYKRKLQSEIDEKTKIRRDLMWIKDNFISMIGQLLVSNEEYQKLDYEIVQTENGIPGFNKMLAIDYDALSYYIELHMPDYICDELVRVYGLSVPVQESIRRFTSLGAAAVYVRLSEEIKSIRDYGLTNRRRKVIARGEGGKEDMGEIPPSSEEEIKIHDNKDDSNVEETSYRFMTNGLGLSNKAGFLERFMNEEPIFKSKILEYAKLRSDESEKNVEERIMHDSICTVYDALNSPNKESNEALAKRLKAYYMNEILGEEEDKIFNKTYLEVFKSKYNKSTNSDQQILLLVMMEYRKEIITKYNKLGKDKKEYIILRDYIFKELASLDDIVEDIAIHTIRRSREIERNGEYDER